MLPSLLKSLLKGLQQTDVPAFPVAVLNRLEAEGTAMLTRLRVLHPVAPAGWFDHPFHGSLRVEPVGEKFYLHDPYAPGVTPIEVAVAELSRVALSQRALAEWIADSNSLDDARDFGTEVWTLGQRSMRGLRVLVVYMPSPRPSGALRELEMLAASQGTAGTTMAISPNLAGIGKDDIARFAAKRIFFQNLHPLVCTTGFDLNLSDVPQPMSVRPKENIFRRTGNGWEVAFGGSAPCPFKKQSGMDEIWFLLRNPTTEFSAAEVVNQLANIPDEDRVVRSRGSRGKGIADLPSPAQVEARDFLRAMCKARDDGDDATLQGLKRDYGDFCKTHGIKDTFAGSGKREGDDFTNEVERVSKAIRRSIKVISETDGLKPLGEHLTKFLKHRATLSYIPAPPVDWRT
jgi:hypothetical protein